MDVIFEIVGLQFKEFEKRLAEKKIKIKMSQEAKKLLMEKGYDPLYEASPLIETSNRITKILWC